LTAVWNYQIKGGESNRINYSAAGNVQLQGKGGKSGPFLAVNQPAPAGPLPSFPVMFRLTENAR
jgi:hypothetical protein